MKFLVTGATGFIGFHVVQAVLNRGYPVVATARIRSSRSRLQSPDIEIRTADLRDPTQCSDAVRGVDAVLHVAGTTRALTEAELLEGNRQAVRNLAGAAASAGVARFVLVSSTAAAGPGTPSRPRRLADPCQPVTAYGRSKLEGEQVLREDRWPFSWTIVRPPVVYGPGDRDVFRLFAMARRGTVPVLGRGDRHNSVIYAPDLAAHLVDLALHPAAAGEVLMLSEEKSYSWLELAEHIGIAVGGGRTRILRVPEWAARVSAAAGSLAGALRRRPSLVSLAKLPEILAPGWVCDPERAREFLDFPAPTPFPAGAAATAEWYRREGWLR